MKGKREVALLLLYVTGVWTVVNKAAAVPGDGEGDDVFKCGNGTNCIPDEWVCNGVDNCPDGSDEVGCTGGFECPNSNRWIPEEWVCNGYANCNDSADETSCNCPEFTCSSGFCISNDKKCDKVNDCGDWSDEPSTCDCPTIEFTCESGYENFANKCLAAEKVCDGVRHCQDGSDEVDSRCDVPCTPEQYRCRTGVSNFDFLPCINNTYICDGYADCVDYSDDSGPCPGCSERCISRTQTYNGYLLKYICIDLKICDGYVDCLDGRDETVARCSCSDGIKCALSDRCLPMTEECDGNNQCGNAKDWTDECDCKDYGDYQVQYCNNTGRCLAPWQMCDGVDDCGDGSDESPCPPAVTDCEYFSEPKYPCKAFTGRDDRCIDMDLVCNGYNDCSDGSDETICNEPCSLQEIRCATGTSTLPGKPICIPESMWCDGTAHCYDHSDENFLICQGNQNGTLKCISSTQCASGKYRCSAGKCIESHQECDGVDDCDDRSDEDHCDGKTDAPKGSCWKWLAPVIAIILLIIIAVLIVIILRRRRRSQRRSQI